MEKDMSQADPLGRAAGSALLTDLYELTMLQAYFRADMNQTAVFEFFVRSLPEQRNFLMAAGLQQVMSYLTALHFSQDDLRYLRDSAQFDTAFLASLHDFAFSGEVEALAEGSIFFAGEPVLRISAPLREAQLIESRLINLLQLQTMVASKAARSVLVAPGKRLVDFGMRRAHGAEAGLLSARASYLAGFDGSSTVLAGQLFGIPVFGTMAHSFIQTHDFESEAFAAFARCYPANATLLIDTYDSEAAAQKVIQVAQWLQQEEGIRINAVRIDSGDLASVALRVRQILDAGDCHHIGIFASGNLDEYALQALLQNGAPIDGFGIGTRMNTSADAPYLDCAYKLVEYAGLPRRKRSSGKQTWPGRKQTFRHYDSNGIMRGDTLGLAGEQLAGVPQLQTVMRAGQALSTAPSLAQIRAHARTQLASLPAALRTLASLAPAQKYPVTISEGLQQLSEKVDERQRTLAAIDQERWGDDAG